MKELTIAIGTEYSGIGYGQLAMQHNLEYEIIYFKSSKYNLRKAEQAVFYCKTCGWVETDNSGYKEELKRFSCQKCKENFTDDKIKLCPKCNSKLKDTSFTNIVFKLKKTGVLANHQAMLMLEHRSKDILVTIEQDRDYQKTTDKIIHTRWNVILG